MKIAHFGTFDVANYGDLLFPAVAQHYLGSPETTFAWISPKGGKVCPDAVETIGVLDWPWHEVAFDLALIGGGNIVHPSPTKLAAYARPRQLGWIAYPALWLPACLKAAECGAAIAWNAPGLMNPPWTRGGQAALTACLRMSDYASFREPDNLDWIAAEVREEIRIVPDTAVTLSRIWTKTSLEPDLKAARSRCGLSTPYFVVHLKSRNLPAEDESWDSRKSVAAIIDRMAQETGLTPVLVPIGRCHGDDEFLRGLGTELRSGAIVASRVRGLRETTALIANAAYVFSASLHCSIVAASYGVPTHLLQFGKSPKYRGFFEGRLGLQEIVVDGIEGRLNARGLADLATRQGAMREAVERACDAVEAHFAAIRAAAVAPLDRAARGAAGRRRLLDAVNEAAPISAYLPVGAMLA